MDHVLQPETSAKTEETPEPADSRADHMELDTGEVRTFEENPVTSGQSSPLTTNTETEMENQCATHARPERAKEPSSDAQETIAGTLPGLNDTEKFDRPDDVPQNRDDEYVLVPEYLPREDNTETQLRTGTDDQQDHYSGIEPETICVRFYAVLRNGVCSDKEVLHLVTSNGQKYPLKFKRKDQAGYMFTCDLSVRKTMVEEFCYTYCITSTVDRRDYFEKLQHEDRCYTYRKLLGNSSMSHKVFHQFDDVCLLGGAHTFFGLSVGGKATVVNKTRSKFIQVALTDLMLCTNKDLSDMQTTSVFLMNCLQIRLVFMNGHCATIPALLHEDQKKITKAFTRAIDSLKNNSTVQCVLAAAFLADFFKVSLDKPRTEKLSEIVRRNGELQGSLASLEDSAKCVIAKAVQYVFDQACRNKSKKGAVWMMSLFYAVLPADYDQMLKYGQEYIPWMSTQRDLCEMIKTHSSQLKKCKGFTASVLDVFDVEHDEMKLLSTLSMTPHEFLLQLLKWQSRHSFRKLHRVVKTIAEQIKEWLKESSEERSELSKNDVHCCLVTTMDVVKKSLSDAGRITHYENVLSVLWLLNAFTVYFVYHPDDEILETLDISKLMQEMSFCIRRQKQGGALTMKDWNTLFELPLPDFWQRQWEKDLKALFIENLQKKSDMEQVRIYCDRSAVCPAMEDCLSSCAENAVKRLILHDFKFNLLKKISETERHKYGNLMSVIIENKLSNINWSSEDYFYLLYDKELKCVFSILDEHQQKHKDHMANLSTQAQSLIDRTYTLMEQLLEEIMNKSIPCKLIKTIINEQENVNRFLLGNNSKRFQNGLEQANKEIRSFEERKSQIKALYDLSQGMQVDVELLESTSSIDLVNEKRSLKAIMEMLLKEEPESEGGNYTYLIDIQMFEKIEVLYKSTYFKETWKETVKQAKDTDFKNVELIPLDQVHGKIFKPTLEKVRKSYEELKDLSMKLQDFENKLGKFKHCVHKELQIMAEVFSEDANTTWINNTEERINRYRELQFAEENAKVINDLKGHLQLGDFGVIEHLGDIGNKCLHDLTHDFYKVGNKVKDIPKDAIGFVKELNECFKRGFISWIKEIIKDTGELSAFVELASISAGENAMDIGKVCCFRDAISAAAPIIFQLSEKSGVEDLLQAISKLTSAIESDRNLEVKLRDSCNNREWLKIAYETHGSVERSSLRQATDINQSGIYIIKNTSAPGSKITLENCITLRCKESSVDGNDDKYREYSLSELKDLQNKLMLITASAENREDEITIYTEVLEHVINVGESYLELRDAGHILFQDWEMRAYCQHTQDAKIWVKFDITNVDIRGHRPLLDELKGLCESMRGCLTEWLKYIEQKRNMYYNLNHFTAKQLVYLCCSVAAFKKDKKSSTGLLNMLSIMKEDIKDSDVEHAFTKALQTPAETGGSQTSLDLRKFLNDFPDMIKYFLDSGFSEEQIKAAIIFCEENNQAPEGYGESEVTDEYRDIVMECIDKNQNDEEWVQEWCDKYEKMRDSVLKNQVKFKGGHGTDEISFTMTEDQIAAAFENLQTSDEKIVMLWKTYHSKLSGLVSDKFVDLDVLGETLNHLAKSATFTVKRKLAFSLEEDKPNLITCKGVEILPLFLSLYSDNDQPLPSIDEVLVCTPDTTAEEVELIIRRAVQPGSTHEKIYSLLNADKLNHDVSRKFESIFYKLSKSLGDTCPNNYHLIIFCDSKAHHSYVATAFDVYKKTVTERPNRNEEIKQYLRYKHQTSSEAKTGFSKLHSNEQFQLRTKLILSEHAGMGKSLYVKNLVSVSEENLKSEGFTHKTIRISESQMRTEDIATQLQQYEDKPLDKVPRVFHFDIPPVVSKGLYRFLIQLFVLRRIQCPDGRIWRCNDSHIYLVEYTKRKNRECDRHNSEISSQMEDIFLEMFPSVKCLSPEETVTHPEQDGSCDKDYQLMHNSEFCSEAFQRTYQYFKRYKMNSLENFFFIPGSVEDSPKEWLECLLHFCDIKNPSWGELRNFTHFLNSQLKKCEQSIFCSEAVRDCLTGFKTFVVKFMITMSKDFSMRSLTTSDDSDEKESNAVGEDTVLKEFQLRRRWEQQAHPYILFNADNESMSFLGFHIHKLDAVDAQTKVVVEKNIIDKRLFNQLKTQRVPFNIDFETMKRSAQLEIISRVLGVNSVTDPDDTYQLTLDNVMKILAIHLRFECDIPVIIMGETGCGKTRLVQFMCDLLRSGKKRQNLIVVRVHGGTTSEIIYKKVREAIKISKENEVHKLDTVLFFDEANTTEAVNAIKEVICDKTVNGEQIDASRLKVIAACNPYRKHSKEAIEQLEQAGLGYRVRCENTQEKLGQIPMRQLVYRVQPLPSSLTPFVWDFGKLNEHTQELYITQMVKTFFQKENLPHEYKPLFTKVISASQKHMTELTDECRMVSLRDIERCMKTVMWFYNQKEKLFTEIDKIRGNKGRMHDLVRSLILAVGVCYLASLQNRQAYLVRISEAFSLSDSDIDTEIDLCKKAFISNVDCPSSVAKNEALNENVFMMVVCINLRIPLFLVGKPGSSKSLSKTIAAHAMQGKASQNDLFKGYKQAQLASFQCSPHSSPDGIISIFRQCAQFQKAKNLDEYVSVVVLDEIGLAEDSPKMPLKTLHPLLEYGCTDDENADDFKKVGFIGISNWSLDPAKMNRGILVLRTSPETGELRNTACDICSSDNEHIKTEIEFLIPMLTKFYLNVLHNQPTEFFGLRDFYSLVKLIVSYATETNGRPSDENLTKAVQRNFEGLDSINILEIFWDVSKQRTNQCDTISLLRENLDMGTSGFTSRYLLLPTTNHAALQILKSQNIIDESNVEVIFGSGFAHDEEYSQVCRTVNRVKTCMETGRSVVLLNIQSLYESLYDALNQCYVKLGGIYYVDLGLGSHRVKCRVKDEFRLIVIEEKSTVYEQFPTPLLNRLEKHCLDFSSILPDHAKQMLAELEDWLDSFSTNYSGETYQLKEKSCCSSRKYDVIVGYTEDTCASVLLQCCPQIVTQELDRDEREVVLEKAKEMLIQCATPDSVLRTPKYLENNSEKLLEMYFTKQTHSNLIAVLKKYRKTIPGGICLEVSTYSRLLNKRDVEQINKELNIEENLSCLFLLNEFYTEQSFSQTVSQFLSDGKARKLLLLQSYFDEPKQSQRLLFCVRHYITQLRRSIHEGTAFDVVLLTRLPRISGGCGYIASFGDDWTSIHLDELILTPGFLCDIYELQKKTVSKILKTSSSYCKENQDTESGHTTNPEEQDMLVDPLLLVKKSLQKGIMQLQDKLDNSQRATERIEILHGLLHNKYPVSEPFIQSLEKRIVNHLSRQEKMEKKENWVIAQAWSDQFVAEGGSFRHVLWVHLEDTVASTLAQIMAVIDGDNNLDNLIDDQFPEKSKLWLKIFQGDQWDLLKIPVTDSQGKVSVLSTSGHKSRTCLFPFSWLLKDIFEQMWLNMMNVEGLARAPNKEYIEKFEELIPLPWIKNIKKDQDLFAMFSEDLVNISMPAYPSELNKSFSDTLLRLTPRFYHDLTGNDPENVSLPWLYVANEYLHNNHQLFYNFYLQNKDLLTAGEATEALRQTLQCLQPKENLLKDFASCQDWLTRVKSLSMTVDLILSEDSLVTRHGENTAELIADIRLFWRSTWIIYLLMDHLLQNESEMEKKLLTILVRYLIFAWKKLNTEEGKQMEYVIEQVTGTLKKCNNNACNVFRVLCGYCRKEFTEDDTAELQCGHMFHMSCLKDHSDTQCIKCKKEINQDYKPCGPVDIQTFLKVNRFRRKCNSFFVEFMWNFVSSKEQLTDKVVNKLMDYVRCSPSTEEPEQSSLQKYMNPDPVVQSLVLKILLRCGMDETAPQLQRFIEEAVKSNQRNTDELYFMVVRSIEDHIHSSSQGCLIKRAIVCLDNAVFITSDQTTISEDLHTIATLRFAISVASDIIRSVLSKECAADSEEREQLLKSLKQLISNTKNPLIQIFLLWNLYIVHGVSIIHDLGQSHTFQWTIPHGIFQEQDMHTGPVDQFLMYGDVYERITIDSVKALEEPTYEIAEEFDGRSPHFPVCMALAAVRQGTHNRSTQENEGCLIAKMKSRTDATWGELVKICEKMLDHLGKVNPILSNTDALSQIVLHTALVAQLSTASEMELLRTLCFSPGKCKDIFVPTMPSSVNIIKVWTKQMIETGMILKIWMCMCGEPVLIGECGRPVEKAQCSNCKREIGGKSHIPVKDFTHFVNGEGSGRGHNLGDPAIRKEQDGERNLYGANLFLVRAMIHSAMLWGTVEHAEDVQSIIQTPHEDISRHLCDHLLKDIEMLARALGKSTEDAEMTVHLFLKFILESNSEPNSTIHLTDTEEKRKDWENAVHKKLQTFLQDFEAEFSSMKSNILRKGGAEALAQIMYSKEPHLKDISTTGVFNVPLMWRFEHRMTIQRLIHLIEQKDERKNVPVLSELLKNHIHIQYIRYLPQVLSFQQKLICHFENLNPHCYTDVHISTFMKENVADDAAQNFIENTEIVQKIWSHLCSINYPQIPKELKQKDANDLKILDFLPTKHSVARVVTEFLIKIQNHLIILANPKEDRIINANEVKSSHVIACIPEQDFLTVAISNIDHVIYMDKKESTNYNFKTVERQLVDRFFTEKPLIRLTTIPLFEYNTGTTLRAFFITVKDKLEPLNTNDRNCIMNDFRFLNEISAALSTLKIAIGFMKLSFPQPEQYLMAYLKKDLKLEDRVQTLSLPVLRTSRVKHIQSLWEVLSLRQASLLIEMNQNPFFMIEDQHFHEVFTEDQKTEKKNILANVPNMDVLITELHYVIKNIKVKDVGPKWTIHETFEAFIYHCEIEEKAIICLQHLQEVEMRHAIALWKLAVQIKKGIKATEP
ncbi:E3 ubiquitin-protein ligase rnf213-alpha-like isoform X2 [Electrophorus electricus]|uniref:E3 ubiquitin-protein ligase rnf213-alpha-like isoform X2 n=1 Tax=Electrophorus electricus TaxID=8005 RepID=UPI0015CFF489|nr:E3 ubiquitin-protein ligase rnf213-alpha-like isoform X2 [Electrophorus electricus]